MVLVSEQLCRCRHARLRKWKPSATDAMLVPMLAPPVKMMIRATSTSQPREGWEHEPGDPWHVLAEALNAGAGSMLSSALHSEDAQTSQ
eukprot:TRINITY_DN47387_c0_g1_i1.p2 TRINITY_DN47387_c0_g1~~TRINITY_DN47387_c0_g1_i1.p2  ORF type:complete len:102 (-),score=14.33 TRINITY_DN47387_c0_g1_i1:22-288(-)